MKKLTLVKGALVCCLLATIILSFQSCRKDRDFLDKPLIGGNQIIKEDAIRQWFKENPLSKSLAPDWSKARQATIQNISVVRVPILNVNQSGKVTDKPNPGYNPKHPPELFLLQHPSGAVAGYYLNFIPEPTDNTAKGFTGQLVDWNVKGDTIVVTEVKNNKGISAKLVKPLNSAGNLSLNSIIKSQKLAVADANGGNGTKGPGGFWQFLAKVIGAIADFLGLPVVEPTNRDGKRLDFGTLVFNLGDWFSGAEFGWEGGGGGGGGTYFYSGGPIQVAYLDGNFDPIGQSADVSSVVWQTYQAQKSMPYLELPESYGFEMLDYLTLSNQAKQFIVTDNAITLTDNLKIFLDRANTSPDYYSQVSVNLASRVVEIAAAHPEVRSQLNTDVQSLSSPSQIHQFEILVEVYDELVRDDIDPVSQTAVSMTIKGLTSNQINLPNNSTLYSNVSSVMMNVPPDFGVYFSTYFSTECAILKFQHPDWPKWKVFYHASKEMLHLVLDGVGLVPVYGEVADLMNGMIYLVEGDGTNATLSGLAMIPFAGWWATGAKFAKKTLNLADGTKTSLKWVATAGEWIHFGNRSQLRKVLQLAKGNIMQAHHLIPWAKSGHRAIQKAAKSKHFFHLNEALNGIPLNPLVHSGSHANYDRLVQAKLDDIPTNLTPEQTYDAVVNIIGEIRNAINSYPNIPINQLIF